MKNVKKSYELVAPCDQFFFEQNIDFLSRISEIS